MFPFPYDTRAAGPVSTFPPWLEAEPSVDPEELVSYGALGVKNTLKHLIEPRMLLPMALGAVGGWYGRPHLPAKWRAHAVLGGAAVAAFLAHVRMTTMGRDDSMQMAGYGAASMPTLRKGATGTAVSQLQTLLSRSLGSGGLKSAGVQGAGWGKEMRGQTFGSNTDKAVRAYQRSKGLGVDGIVGRKTWGSFGLVGVGGYTSSAPAAPAPQAAPALPPPPGAGPGAGPGPGPGAGTDEGSGTPGWLIPVVLGVGSLALLGVTYKIVSGGRA